MPETPPAVNKARRTTKKRVVIAAGAALAIAAVVTTIAVTLGAPNNGSDAGEGATASATGPGALAWSSELGAESWGTPAVAGDLVVVGTNDGMLRAFEHADGTAAWEFDTGGELRSAALVSDDALYVTSDSGAVFALDHDGEELWSMQVGNGPARTAWDNFGSRPALDGDTLFVGTADGRVLALSSIDGSLRWVLEAGAPIRTDIATGDGRVYAINNDGLVRALDAASGAVLWEYRMGGAGTTAPAFADGVLVVGSRGLKVLGLDAATGEERWSSSYGGSWVQSGGTIVDGRVTIGSSDISEVRQYDLAGGEMRWNARIGGWPWGVPAHADGVYYATNVSPENLKPWKSSVFALDGESGEVLWEAGTGPALEWKPFGDEMFGIVGSPVVTDEFVIVAGLDGVLSAFRR